MSAGRYKRFQRDRIILISASETTMSATDQFPPFDDQPSVGCGAGGNKLELEAASALYVRCVPGWQASIPLPFATFTRASLLRCCYVPYVLRKEAVEVFHPSAYRMKDAVRTTPLARS